MEQKVLVYGLTSNRGGMESYFITYYEEIKRKELPVKFDFVTDFMEIAYQEIIEKYGDKIYFIPSRRQNLIKHICDLRRLIKKNAYTKVYFNVLSASSVFTIAAAFKIKGCKIIVHSHNDYVKAIKRHLILRPLLNVMVDIRLACSVKAGNFMFGEKYTKRNEVTIIKNAIKPEMYPFSEDIREKKRADLKISNSYVVGTVGRLCYQKNTLFLLDIFSQLLNKIPEAFLVIVGEGELHAEVEKKINDLGLKHHVLLLGMRKDVPALLQAMDIFVFPSRFEGLGMAAIEAQCTGLTTVASLGVPEEAKIISRFVRLPLKNVDEWIDTIYSFYLEDYRRISCHKEIREHGFDIHTQSSKLVEILEKE
ncbi:MAG: glycosyltransferase [Clostridiales bacterium]|nr:glycosyltransferase [Clostridiales bacterium]